MSQATSFSSATPQYPKLNLSPFDPQRMMRRAMYAIGLMLHAGVPLIKPGGHHTHGPTSVRHGKPAGMIRRQIMARRAHDSGRR